MNMWVSAEPINPATYVQDVIARKRRLMGTPRRPVAPEMHVIAEAPSQKRHTFLQVRLPADAHIWAWAKWKQRMTMGGKEYINSRCDDFRVSAELIMGPSQKPEAVWYRDQITFEIRTYLKPTRSWTQIGRLFGKDHTSAISACRRAAARHGDTAAQALVDQKHRRSAEWHQRARDRVQDSCKIEANSQALRSGWIE